MSFDYLMAVLPQITPEQLTRTWQIEYWKGRTEPDGRAMIMNMFVHTAHHRALCEVYLRVKGIKPPNYTYGPQAFVEVRNQIVHPRKRHKLKGAHALITKRFS
jgi:uncharacterized damage-inducible protein DinB